ncbi:MAG: hypothetical protein RBR63_08185, partial [Methanosarcina vacuolata]|nr:hypothetical protein [Methanosarcina vacuolata]
MTCNCGENHLTRITKKRSFYMTWPITSGDYVVGDPKSPVAVVTL